MKDRTVVTAGAIGIISLIVINIAAMLTHIVSCLLAAKYILLLIGVIAFPVGIIHGVGLWFGVAW